MGNLARMVRTGWTVLRKPLVVKTRPLHFYLEPATGCNLACRTCSIPQTETFRNFTLEQFKHCFDQIRPIKVALSGAGEPFLNPELLDLVQHAKANGASALTTTNFTLVHRKLEDIVRSGLDLIKVSLDAATAPTYERIRGRDFFERIIEDLRALQGTKERLGSATPYVRLQFVMQADNVDEMPQMIRLAGEVGADSVYFQSLDSLLIPERRDDLTRGVTREVLSARLEEARKLGRELRVSTNAGLLLKNLDFHGRKYEAREPGGPPQRACLMPWFSLYITIDGNARPCCSFGSGETLVLGNLFEEPFEKIWNGERYQELRRQCLERRLGYAVCRNCRPNRLRDFVQLTSVLPGFFRPCRPRQPA